ncbi:MAG TPA: hypothetical protein VGN13_05610 [Solirubrobacteraceae bacterium]|jgi:hypothetical protein
MFKRHRDEVAEEMRLAVRHRGDVEAQSHRVAILERFEEASRQRRLAVDLHARAEAALAAATVAHEEARKALRRVAEGAV